MLIDTYKKSSDRSMEVELPAHLENYDRSAEQPTCQPSDRRRTDRAGHREVSFPISNSFFTMYCMYYTYMFANNRMPKIPRTF